LLVAQLRSAIAFFTRVDEQHRQSLVDERVWTMLHLTRRVTFCVNVGDLFQLQRAFERDRKVDATTEVEKVSRAEELFRQLLDAVRIVEQMLEFYRQLG